MDSSLAGHWGKFPGVHSMNIRVGGCRWSSKTLNTFVPCLKAKVRPINIPTRAKVWKSIPIFIPELENLYVSLYLIPEIGTHPYTKWQKSRPIPIPELKNCDPSERHLRTRHFLGVNPPGESFMVSYFQILLYNSRSFLAIWLLLFQQRRMQFIPIKTRLFCWTGGQEQ